MFEFAASGVALVTDAESGCRMLGFAEDPDGDGVCLIVMRDLSFDDRDRGLGRDTYCLVDADQRTSYGGVVSWSIEGGVVVVSLDQKAGAAMGVNGYRIAVDASDDA
jgi:hypothetical protein